MAKTQSLSNDISNLHDQKRTLDLTTTNVFALVYSLNISEEGGIFAVIAVLWVIGKTLTLKYLDFHTLHNLEVFNP